MLVSGGASVAYTPSVLDYEGIRGALEGVELPCAFVDVDALDRNIARVRALVSRQELPLRVASKSVRVVSLLRRIIDGGGSLFQGVMCFSCAEAVFLAQRGFDDLLIAYPPFQKLDLNRVARLSADGVRVAVMCDSPGSLRRLSRAGVEHGTTVNTVLCVDMSLKALGGRVHVGVRRSPLHEEQAVLDLADQASSLPGVNFYGLMGYEAQVAGLGDANPFEPRANVVKSMVRRVSAFELGRRRRRIVDALGRAGLTPVLVNGGGSGSLDTTTRATGVTEVTAGSAFLKPHLFDYFRNAHMQELEPAAFFAVEITRRPTPDIVTCLGGGYIASGATSPDKQPLPYLPHGLSLLDIEGAGEVQTPLRVAHDAGVSVSVGDPVIFRHAKAGELAERFERYHLVSAGKVVDTVPTYRGEGQCFL